MLFVCVPECVIWAPGGSSQEKVQIDSHTVMAGDLESHSQITFPEEEQHRA